MNVKKTKKFKENCPENYHVHDMDLLEALIFNVLQAIGLVPPSGKYIKRYLPADGEGEAIVSELLL